MKLLIVHKKGQHIINVQSIDPIPCNVWEIRNNKPKMTIPPKVRAIIGHSRISRVGNQEAVTIETALVLNGFKRTRIELEQ